jgi:hypothetical protein
MTTRSPESDTLLEQLERSLSDTLVAQSTLGRRADSFDEPGFAERKRGDLVFVQGRGDRLHAILCAGPAELSDDDLLGRFADVDVNWAWLAVAGEDVPAAIILGEQHRFGVLSVGKEIAKVHSTPRSAKSGDRSRVGSGARRNSTIFR